MARSLADENFPLPVVEALRKLGHDVVTLSDVGKANTAFPDLAVLQLATAESRALLTLDRRHFARLHAMSTDHGGLVLCTFDVNFESQALRVDEHVRAVDDLARQLLQITRTPTPG